MSFATVASGISGSVQGNFGSSELRADKRGAYYALMKNPDHYVQYQQAQQQTEDQESLNQVDQDEEAVDGSDDKDADQDLDQEVIHLWMAVGFVFIVFSIAW